MQTRVSGIVQRGQPGVSAKHVAHVLHPLPGGKRVGRLRGDAFGNRDHSTQHAETTDPLRAIALPGNLGQHGRDLPRTDTVACDSQQAWRRRVQCGCRSKGRHIILSGKVEQLIRIVPVQHPADPGSNPIESVFATVRHRTVRTKGALSQKTAKLMVFTLIQAASKKWLRLKGKNQLPKVIEGIKFNDGFEETENRAA